MAAYAERSLTKTQLPTFPAWLQAGRPSLFAKLLAALRLWRRRVREREQLARLTTRELADFGATTADVYRELSSPFWRAPPPC